jgi:hypothetical protein
MNLNVETYLEQVVSSLRLLELAMLGTSLDCEDDRAANDIRGMSISLGDIRQRLNALRSTPEHQLAGAELH